MTPSTPTPTPSRGQLASYGVSTEDVNGIGNREARRVERTNMLAARALSAETVVLADAA